MDPRGRLLNSDDMEEGIARITCTKEPPSKCFLAASSSIMIVPPSVFPPGGSTLDYANRMGLAWARQQLEQHIDMPCIAFVHSPQRQHWSLLVRTQWRQWYVIDSYFVAEPIESIHLAIASSIEGGQTFMMATQSLLLQKSNWECGYLALAIAERLLSWCSTNLQFAIASYHGRQKLMLGLTYETAMLRAFHLLPATTIQ